MKSSYLTFAIVLIALHSYAKKEKPALKLVEAYTQTTLPGIPGARPATNYYFIIRWETSKMPETFFWRGDNGWQTCNMTKVHKVTRTHNMPDVDYAPEKTIIAQIHKGDTLQLVPVAGGKFPVPAEIPVTAKNTIFYKYAGSNWLSLPVKNIGKKKDVAMP